MPRYAIVQRLLHWLIALIVIASLAIGLTLGQQDFNETLDTFGQYWTNILYKYHKTFGVLILGAMVLRLIARLTLGKPDYLDDLNPFSRYASQFVHFLLYVLLFTQPVLGWLATGAGGFPIEFFDWNLPKILTKDKALSDTLYYYHTLSGRTLAVLVVGHISAALVHAFVLRDEVFRRMRLY